jgi:hypothetical protein
MRELALANVLTELLPALDAIGPVRRVKPRRWQH